MSFLSFIWSVLVTTWALLITMFVVFVSIALFVGILYFYWRLVKRTFAIYNIDIGKFLY
jgi:hypothetical protein